MDKSRSRAVLVVNAGSSSIKVAVFDTEPRTPERVLSASVSDIGQPHPHLDLAQPDTEPVREAVGAEDHAAALHVLLERLGTHIARDTITAVGHRIVHGGPSRDGPQEIDDALLAEIRAMAELDPEHAPAALATITEMRRLFPRAFHAACFDTAFFHDLPHIAQLIPLPARYRELGLRRYGFHGLSYSYLQQAFQTRAGSDAANGKVIYAHLGSGASLAATHRGKPVDTTMGFSPVSGLVMSTRSGDLDPNLSWHLQQTAHVSPEKFHNIVNNESGLLGVSGLSSDMYALLQAQSHDPAAADAVELFCYQTKKAIGSLAATMGGVDSLIFSGGIGEKSAELRRRICADLAFIGISLDKQKNEQHAFLISGNASRVGVHVLATDEEYIIATQTANLMQHNTPIQE